MSGLDIKNINNSDEDSVYDPMEYVAPSQGKARKGRPATGTNLDRRRQIHVKCEHRRRKEIQDALEALEAELPPSAKGRSKGAIIVDSAELIKELTFTLDHLLNENQSLLNHVQVDELTKQ